MRVIDASNLILGRLAAYVAKGALQGETFKIINCERTVITGPKKSVFANYKQKRELGGPMKGPFFPKRAEAIVRRTVRGMIPYKQTKGKIAFKNVQCFIGVPEDLQNMKIETLEFADITKSNARSYTRLGDLSIYLGGKI
jgi:large subunit ribosomal protein L13